MMRLIIGSSLRFRYLVLALGVVLTWFGLARLQDVPVDVFPEFAPPRVEIQTICLGLSSAEVEQLVSVPLENALNGVPGVDVMRSKSVPQLSSIVLIFKPGADEIRARQLVSERMALASKSLPTWAAPPFMMPPLSSTSRLGAGGVAGRRADAVVPLLDQAHVVEPLVGRVAPELAADALVQPLGERLGEPVGEGFQQDRVVVVDVLAEGLDTVGRAEPGGDGERADVVLEAGGLRGHEVGEIGRAHV